MLPARYEIDTRLPEAPDTFAVAGLRLDGLTHVPMVLRHEKSDASADIVDLFGMDADVGTEAPQVFVYLYSLPSGKLEFENKLAFYRKQQRRFGLEGGLVFSPETLSIRNVRSNWEHSAFQTRDGRTRRRLVHIYQSERQAVIVVFSIDSDRFFSKPLFQLVSENLQLASNTSGAA